MFQYCCIIFRRMSFADVSFSQSVQTGSKDPFSFLSKGYREPVRAGDYPPLCSVEIQNPWSYKSTSPHGLITRFLLKTGKFCRLIYNIRIRNWRTFIKKKCNVSFSTPCRRMGVVEVWLHPLLTLPLDRCLWSTSRCGRLKAGKVPLYSLNI